ncbi:MAG: hypothetical protein QOJ09_628 [Actinomycetota bacterium]|nr:hypothetical protein [Actinomycetota bacterium]
MSTFAKHDLEHAAQEGPHRRSVAALMNPPRLPTELLSMDAHLAPEAEWSDAEITGDFSGLDGSHADIVGCRLASARLTAAELVNARITDTLLTGCDLAGARLDQARLTRVELRDCRLSGLLLGGTVLQDVRFADCKLDSGHLRMSKGERVEFASTVLTGADFGGSRWAHARFFDCDLTGADFSGAKLAGARLHGSVLDDVRGALDLGGVIIDSDQIVALGFRVLAALGVGVDDAREC